MPKVDLTKRILLDKRAELICELSKDFSDIELEIIFNIDRTWVYRIRKEYKKANKSRK